jgi:glycogen synthase
VRPTAIHAHSPLLNGYPALWVARRHRLPVIYEVRAFWEDAAVDQGTASEGGLRYRATRALETHLMRRVDAVVPICNGLHADIAARGISESKMFTVRNFVDLSHFKRHYPIDFELRNKHRLSNCIVLGFIGSFYPYAGLLFLLQAVTRLFSQRADVKLLLVGGGPQAAKIEQEIAQQGLSDRVIMTGRVPHEEIDRYYDLVDILVYPRRRMRLTEIVTPIKPLEAMAKGKNILASDVGGHRELIVDQVTGRLFDADSIDDFLLKLNGMLDDEQLLSGQAENARAHVARRHSVEMAAECYAAIFKSVLDLTPPRHSWLRKAERSSLTSSYRKTT